MCSWEKPILMRNERRKTPSFSSSLLEAIYLSIDESKDDMMKGVPNKRNNGVEAEEEIASLRRAILVEKWMESYKFTQSSAVHHFTCDSGSSTESSMFSSSETESASRLNPRSSVFPTLPKPARQVHETLVPKCEDGGGRFMRTKSRDLKIYGDLKKVKQPISPGGKIANFLNAIFNSRNMKKNHHRHQGLEDWKSRSVNDSGTLATKSSCLINKTPSNTTSKSKRSVRFCPVSVIVDEDSQPCGHKSIYQNEEPRRIVGSHCTNSGFQNFEEKHLSRHRCYDSEDEEEEDGRSCASSDLFELDNIGMIGHVRDGLPVYGTTSFKMNQSISRGLVM